MITGKQLPETKRQDILEDWIDDKPLNLPDFKGPPDLRKLAAKLVKRYYTKADPANWHDASGRILPEEASDANVALQPVMFWTHLRARRSRSKEDILAAEKAMEAAAESQGFSVKDIGEKQHAQIAEGAQDWADTWYTLFPDIPPPWASVSLTQAWVTVKKYTSNDPGMEKAFQEVFSHL